MNRCDKDCQSNKDGICLGNWSECPARKREEKVSTDMMCLILMVIVAIFVLFYAGRVIGHEKAEEAPQLTATQMEQQPYLWLGHYTIFQYTQNGWSNHMYVTEFYKQDGFLYYRLKDYPDEYMFIKAEGFLPVPGWVEDPNELMKYGFWEPMESEW
jgi:hypothetical protein